MNRTLRFLVNDRVVETSAWEGSPLLDFLRLELGLTGTKEGCREGDCGACAVLVGERVPSSESGAVLVGERVPSSESGAVRYRAMPSCLLALGELDGRQLVTIEGLAAGAEAAGEAGGLTPVMRAFVEENASQCGFCTPGFIISLTAWLLEGGPFTEEGAVRAVEGNLCRCTGYASIRRAASRIIKEFGSLPADPLSRIEALVKAAAIPPSVAAFARGELLAAAPLSPDEAAPQGAKAGGAAPVLVIGGGTDLYVRDPDPEPREGLVFLDRYPELRRIERKGDSLEIGAAVTIRDFFASPLLCEAFAGIEKFESSFASILVRNRATLGGNVANASPVADVTSMLIALGAIALTGPAPGGSKGESPAGASREIPLEKLYLSYKKLDLSPGEIVAAFRIPTAGKARGAILFNFEKASKRASLDIAAVNTAIRLEVEDGRIRRSRLSAGGVAATPLLLSETSAFLEGKPATAATAREAAKLARAEVSPIGDVRGSADYRGRVLERLVLAHFAALVPGPALEPEELLR